MMYSTFAIAWSTATRVRSWLSSHENLSDFGAGVNSQLFSERIDLYD